MEVEKQNSKIAIYPSILRFLSYTAIGLAFLAAGISFISSNKQAAYTIILFILGSITSLYGIINLVFRNKPVILFDKFGFLYSAYSQARLFVPKELIMGVSLRNTPNKRIIITLKPAEIDYKQYLKNLRLPSHLQTCHQNTSKLKGNNIIISTENLNANNAVISKQLQQYLHNNI